MAANTQPIYSKAGDIQWGSTDGNGGTAGPLKTANTAMDGTGTVLTVFTADATNGGRVERIRFKAAGTNVATVARVFINNGSTNATAANNVLFAEVTLGSSTASAVAALVPTEIPNNLPLTGDPTAFPLVLQPGYKINVTLGTTVAAGYYCSAVGGKY